MKELSEIAVRDCAPYPEIKVTRENKLLAARLSALYCGSAGELTSIMDYTYQSFVFEGCYPEYAELFGKLAGAEMKHMDMLGRLIVLLGEDPVFADSSCRDGKALWTAENVTYDNNLLNVLYADLRGEQAAYNSYVSLARRSGDRYVFAVLNRIALDEMLHVSVLKTMIARLSCK